MQQLFSLGLKGISGVCLHVQMQNNKPFIFSNQRPSNPATVMHVC